MQVIDFPYIYNPELKHHLRQIGDTNDYIFEPAEEWMNDHLQITWNLDGTAIAMLDAPGMGHGIWVGDIIEGKRVAEITWKPMHFEVALVPYNPKYPPKTKQV